MIGSLLITHLNSASSMRVAPSFPVQPLKMALEISRLLNCNVENRDRRNLDNLQPEYMCADGEGDDSDSELDYGQTSSDDDDDDGQGQSDLDHDIDAAVHAVDIVLNGDERKKVDKFKYVACHECHLIL